MIRIGILGAADIAVRRFLPPLINSTEYELAGIASGSTYEKGLPFADTSNIADNRAEETQEQYQQRIAKVKAVTDQFGGSVYDSYESMLRDESIDAVYIPLPPACHYYWGRKALLAGKHVYMEKPFTTNLKDTEDLISLARDKGVAVFENYGFTYHKQVELIDKLMQERLGDLRLLRAYFGFPKRKDSDFRYSDKLGGGSLLDAGGYAIKIARHYLGDELRILASSFSEMPGHDVDGWGSVMAVGRDNVVCQLSFGMDNQYKCDLELWGSVGTIHAPRIFTPPPQFVPKISVTDMNGTEYFESECDDAFAHSQELFAKGVTDINERTREYEEILIQSRIVNEVKNGQK